MSVSNSTAGRSRNLILAAMIFAVAMTFIDQTIVSIAAPEIQKELGLTSTGMQWAINAYLLSLAALFAFGGRLADTVGHRKMVTLGVVIFAGASAMCGLTPKGSLAEAWIVTFRVVQGAGGAIMFPAALAIVVQTFALRERGRALAIFFGIAGGLTAIGPILGGYLTQWTWRAIFWVNIPVAIIALVLIVISKPVTVHRPARMDYRGLVLIASGVALSVFGFQQSSIWGWSKPGTWACIVVGAALLVVFYFVELRTASPLIQVQHLPHPARSWSRTSCSASRCWCSSRCSSSPASTPRSRSARRPRRPASSCCTSSSASSSPRRSAGGCSTASAPSARSCSAARSARVGFWLWAGKVTGLDFGSQQWYIILAGAGMGLMLGPASTDAVNRASRLSYGEATGITQTVRNYAASLGLAILGTILVSQMRVARRQLADRAGRARARARTPSAASISQSQGGSGQRRLDPALRAARLRLRHALGALRDGGDHGRRRGRRPGRPARGGAGGHGRGGR